ncbi:MAG: sugar MFS transporter [Raineya sp.]
MRFSLFIIGIFYFIFGFVTWLNSVLIPYLKIACQLESNLQAYLVAFAFYISYFVMALPSAWLLQKTGFKNGMAWGLIVMALGALIFIPAAQTRLYNLFLLGLFVQGTGLAILQTAANPYVAVLGKPESAAQRISIMGIANKVAGIISPIVLGAIVFAQSEDIESNLQKLDAIQKNAFLQDLAAKVILPYGIMAVVLLALALMLRFTPLPNVDKDLVEENKAESAKKSIWQYPQLVLGVIALFLYVGVEVIAGDTIIQYGISWGIDKSEAKFFTSLTLTAMLIGYVVAIFTIPRYISQEKMLVICSLLGLIFSTMILLSKGFVSVLGVALLGLANSVMWPAIFPLAIADLGRHTKTGSAMLIMAIAGGALLPLLYGYLADIPQIGFRYAYFVLLPAYLFIAFYGAFWAKKRNW